MFALVMIAALANALVNGMYNSWESLDRTLHNYLEEYGIADAVIATDITKVDTAEKIRQVEGIADVTARMTGSTQLIAPSGDLLTAQIISLDKQDTLRLVHWEDADMLSGDYVLADQWFATKNGISAGDVLSIRTGEDEYRAFTVGAIVSAPETIERTKLDLGGRRYPDYGFLYAPVTLLKQETEKESERMTAEWKEKESEYLEAEKELEKKWEEGLAELENAREELEKNEQEYEAKREELKEQIRQLTEGRIQLTQGRKELDDAEKTAEAKKEELEQTLERSSGQILELEDRITELHDARNELGSLLVRLEDAKGQLAVTRNRITESKSQLQHFLEIMRRVRTIWKQARDGGTIRIPEDIRKILDDNNITPENLDALIRRAESGAVQLENGETRIRSGIASINQTYLPEIAEYLEETEQGLEVISYAHDTLRDGIAEMESGLKAITDFEQETPENRAIIEENLQSIREAIESIYSGLEEAEMALEEGREQLEMKNAEAETSYTEAREELDEGARELQEAWDRLISWEGYTPLRNEFLIWFDEDVTDRYAVLKDVEEVLDVNVQKSELYEDSNVKSIIDDNLDPMWSMSVMIPVLFISVMMMVLFLFLSIMIRQSRQTIGILRALGFERKTIRRSYCFVCILLMLAATVIGGAGSTFVTVLFNNYYKKFFSIPDFYFSFNWGMLAISGAVFILLSVVAVGISSRAINQVQPAEAISRMVSIQPKIGRAARKLLHRVDPLSKFSLLSLKRNPFRFFASVVCLSGAVCMIFGALSFAVAKNELLTQVFDHQIVYDAQIVFNGEPDETAKEKIRGMDSITAAERFWTWKGDIESEGKRAYTVLLFMEEGTQMVAFTDPERNPMAYPTEGIVLSATTANNLGVKTGDTVTIAGTKTTVTGISRQLCMDFQYLPAAERERYPMDKQTGWLVLMKEGSGKQEITEEMAGQDGYIITLWRSVMEKSYRDLFISYDLFVYLLIIICAIVGIFIVVNTNRNNLQEQKFSLSVLRTIGFQQRQISCRWFLQSLLYLVCSLAVGYLTGQLLARVGVQILSNSSRHFEYISSVYQYFWTAVLVFVYMLVGHWISMRSMKKWDLVENTKGRE